MKKNKTSKAKIANNIKWANNNLDRVRVYKQKYKDKTKQYNRALAQQIKESNPCKICGETRFYCLDFHHRDPATKKDTICNLIRHGYSTQIVKEEIDKCDIICSNCHRKEHTNTYKYLTKKARYVLELKQKSLCSKCQLSIPECLDFHHIDDNKTDGIGSMLRDKNISLEEIKSEIEKCIVVCSNCHREIHYYLK
jgi:hypothetical protein